MRITYIHHSCFLIETDSCYYLFDYEKGQLPPLEPTKPIFVLASHWHHDHYTAEIFAILESIGMQTVYAVLSEEIYLPQNVDVLQVAANKEYHLCLGQTLTTFLSTDVGVAFLINDGEAIIYHAGDLNDWVWEEESAHDNDQMTKAYREQIDLLSQKLDGKDIDVAFVVLDPRQEKDYDRGLCYFLEHVSARKVYPMHYWGEPQIIETFLAEHPQYANQIQKPE